MIYEEIKITTITQLHISESSALISFKREKRNYQKFDSLIIIEKKENVYNSWKYSKANGFEEEKEIKEWKVCCCRCHNRNSKTDPLN